MVHGIPGQMVLHALSYKASSLSVGFPPTPFLYQKSTRHVISHPLRPCSARHTDPRQTGRDAAELPHLFAALPEPRVVCRHLDQATCPAQRPLSSTCAGPWFIVAYPLRLQVRGRLPSDPHRFLSSLYPLIIGPSFENKRSSKRPGFLQSTVTL